MNQPLVSIICLCYNHAPFIVECLTSVQRQTYPLIELIIVDDYSTDQSVSIIKQHIAGQSDIIFLALEKNLGNCAAFNKGLALATGKYIIDLAGDDILLPNRVEEQVMGFEQLSDDYAVIFSDAILINEQGKELTTYYSRNQEGKLIERIPSGQLYTHLIRKAFICTPTMMMRKAVLDELGGYDESLSYEDYDFWVRSGRKYAYYFQDLILTKKRIVSNSHRTSFYQKKQNAHLTSTLKICWKAYHQNLNQEEHLALAVSVRYHMRQSLYMEVFELVEEYAQLLQQLDHYSWNDRLVILLGKWKAPLNFLYNYYLRLRKQ